MRENKNTEKNVEVGSCVFVVFANFYFGMFANFHTCWGNHQQCLLNRYNEVCTTATHTFT